MWSFSPWALLPPLYSLFTAAGLWTVYFVAVKSERIAQLGSEYRRNGSLYPPYISIAGNFPPAACIFSEVMNLSAFVGLIIAVFRYLQLKHRLDKQWLNIGSLVVFSVACFGMTLVGNFQILPEKAIHNFGTCLTFGLGVLFCWVQSYITIRVNLKGEGRKVGIVRFLLSACITTCMIPYFALMLNRFHMQAAQSQWVLVMLFLTFLGTFAVEFRHSRFSIMCTDDSGGPGNYSETVSDVSRFQPDQM